MRYRLALALLLLPAACRPTADADVDGGTPAERCAFSFVILTDTHVGEGVADFGTAGWDDLDDSATASDSEAVLAAAVTATNALAAADQTLRFVVVLGDLTDSGERSELQRAHDLLNELTLPWLPLLGNHDTWPYARDEAQGTWDEADLPNGNALLLDIFADAFDRAAAAFPSLVRAPPVFSPEIGADSALVNYAFEVCGTRFLALDTNTHVHAGGGEPGVGPEAALHDSEGGTWPWALADLVDGPGADAPTAVILAHHPFIGAGSYTFTPEEFARVEASLEEHALATRVAAFFAGHIHMTTELDGPLGLPIVLTAATKDGTAPRVVRVSDQGILEWED